MDDMIIVEYIEEFELAVEDALEHKTLATVGIALSWWQSLLNAVTREPEGPITDQYLLEKLTGLLPDEWAFWMVTWDSYYQERKPYTQCH